ncbi:MAG: hypothetical protein WD873_03260 [Candidatus Hydrogenedentales bacterium]
MRRFRIAEGLDSALDRTRRLLFTPARGRVWLACGILAFLSVLFDYQTSWGWSIFGDRSNGDSWRSWLEHFQAHPLLYSGVGLLIFVGAFLWIIVTTWITSRGLLMFARAVLTQETEVEPLWHAVGPQADSLFMLRATVKIAGLVITAVVVALAFLFIHVGIGRVSDSSVVVAVAMAPFAAVAGLAAFAVALFESLTAQFVVPLMLLRGDSCSAAWRRFIEIARHNALGILLFYLAHMVIVAVGGVAAVVVGIATLMLGFLPVIHHTLLAPLYVFDRALSLNLIEQAEGTHAQEVAELW